MQGLQKIPCLYKGLLALKNLNTYIHAAKTLAATQIHRLPASASAQNHSFCRSLEIVFIRIRHGISRNVSKKIKKADKPYSAVF
jgi:hypothetical protein